MSSANIQKKVKAGLAKAIAKTGSASSDEVFLVTETITGGDGTPLNPGAVTQSETLLKDAVFKAYDKSLVGANIQTGDREMVSNNDVEIKTGDTIKAGNDLYIVIDVDTKAPAGDALAYISQVRLK